MKVRKKDGTWKEIIYSSEQLYKYGINRLSEREFGSKELFKKMQRLQPESEIITAVIEKLKAQGYLSDERRANSMFRQFDKNEGIGKIKQRMALKGLDKDLIRSVIESHKEFSEDGSEVEKALGLIVKKYKQYAPELNQKIYRFLVSKGFDSESSQKAIKRFKDNTVEF